jgi:hypothetical protein
MKYASRLQRVYRFAGALVIAGAFFGGAATLAGSRVHAESRPFAPGEPACVDPNGQPHHEGEIITVGDPGHEVRYVCGSDGNFHPLPTAKLVSRGLSGPVVANELAPQFFKSQVLDAARRGHRARPWSTSRGRRWSRRRGALPKL